MDNLLSIIKKNFKNKYKKSIYTKKTIKLRSKKLDKIANLDIERIAIRHPKKKTKKNIYNKRFTNSSFKQTLK